GPCPLPAPPWAPCSCQFPPPLSAGWADQPRTGLGSLPGSRDRVPVVAAGLLDAGDALAISCHAGHACICRWAVLARLIAVPAGRLGRAAGRRWRGRDAVVGLHGRR